MFSHIMVGSNNIERSQQFYNAVLAVLGVPAGGASQAPTGHTRVFYRHEGGVFGVSEPINGEPATFANGATIGFKCSSPEQVVQFHDVAVANGGV
jgi:catechol 2,3-dioxygenase-like lactoylglutathione lyase family enzyme